jgi:TP901 family phage tail tape measure protein
VAKTLAELIVRVGADATQFEKHMGKIEKRLTKVGGNLQQIGSRLTTGLTVPLAAAGGGALAASVSFESAFAGVRKTVDATEEELATLSDGIRQMAKETPQSATAIAGIAEAAGQLGIQTENILSFTKTMADLGVATNMTSDEAATALARLANITQMPQSEFDRLGSTIVALGNNLATTEAEIVEMGLRIAGAGSQVGMTEAEILGFAGALSSVGIAAEAGGSAISKVMINIASEVATGGNKLQGFAQVAGMSSEEFAQAWQDDAAGALVTFIEGLGRMSAEGENVFGVLDELGLSEIRVRDALLRASGAGDLFRQSLELGSQAWTENTALTNEAAQRYETTESKLQILKNQLVDVGITLGDALAPAFSKALEAAKPLIDALARMAERFANLDPGMQQTIITVLAVVAAIGPLLMVLGTMIKLGGEVAGVIRLLPGVFGALTSPIGLVVAAVAGLIAIFVHLFNTNEEFREGVLEIWEAIRSAGEEIWGNLSETLGSIWASLQETFEYILGAMQVFWDTWGNTLLAIGQGVWDAIVLVIQTAIDLVAGIINLVLALIRGDWEAVWEEIKGIGETIWGFISGAAQIFADTLSGIWNGIKETALNVWESIKEGIFGIWKGLVNGVIGFINSIINAMNSMIRGLNKLKFSVPDWVPVIGGKSFGFNLKLIANIPQLAQGGIVTAPTLAMIGEAGPEAVVPLSRMDRTAGNNTQVVIQWSSLARPSDSEVRQVAGLLNRELGRMMGARA